MGRRKISKADVQQAYEIAADAKKSALFSLRRARQLKDGADKLNRSGPAEKGRASEESPPEESACAKFCALVGAGRGGVMKQEERKLLTREEVLALLHDCYENLSNTKYVEMTKATENAVLLSLRLAEVYSELQGAKNVSEVGAIGFEYVEPEDLEEDEEEEAEE